MVDTGDGRGRSQPRGLSGLADGELFYRCYFISIFLHASLLFNEVMETCVFVQIYTYIYFFLFVSFFNSSFSSIHS